MKTFEKNLAKFEDFQKKISYFATCFSKTNGFSGQASSGHVSHVLKRKTTLMFKYSVPQYNNYVFRCIFSHVVGVLHFVVCLQDCGV